MDDMQQITILGASGLVGRSLVQKALNNRLKVKVLIRENSKLNRVEKLKIVEGNYFDKNKLEEVLRGSDAVLSTIGPPRCGTSFEDEAKYINSLVYIINQMQANKQSRWIGISGAGIKMPNENLPLARKLIRVKLKEISKSSIRIKDKELQLLEQCALDWTNIRPPEIKVGVAGKFYADAYKFLGESVDLNQLTDFMLAEISNNKWFRKAPVVATK